MARTMNSAGPPAQLTIATSACPHDCPSTCALEVEVLDGRSIGRVRGAEDNLYTAGVICAKVARYSERIHHPDRLLHPLVRKGPKGSGQFAPISWDDALDLTAEKLLAAEARYGSEAVWPYYYAGTMGLVMRDGVNRLRHVKKYSGFHSTICVNPAWTGFIAGTGKLAGPDPREMAQLGPRGDLGHQSGQHAGQRDDPRDPRPQRARRQDRRGRHLPERHHAAGRPRRAGAARHRRRARLRGDALPVPRRLRRPRLPREIHRRAARAGSACAHALARLGLEDHRLPGRDDRSVCAPRRREQAHLLSPRLRLRPLAQRRHQHACGELHRGGARLMGAGRRRRVPQQRRDLSLGQDHHRGARRARSDRSACSTSRASGRFWWASPTR